MKAISHKEKTILIEIKEILGTAAPSGRPEFEYNPRCDVARPQNIFAACSDSDTNVYARLRLNSILPSNEHKKKRKQRC